jgi:hypothetical protein
MCFAVPQCAIDLLNNNNGFHGTALNNAFFDIFIKRRHYAHAIDIGIISDIEFLRCRLFKLYRSDDHHEAVLLFLIARGNAARQFR